ncbi:MAG: hypothetical protein R3346_04035 [Candidatus Spechtbacterales bacterium]|nr:hypothetical protein [Candidatus Spechtbacterales bacterium]
MSGAFDKVLQDIDRDRKESRKIAIENAISRLEAAVRELEFALFEFDGAVDQEFVYKLALIVKERVQSDPKESELKDFFNEFDNRLEMLKRYNDECAPTNNVTRFRYKQSQIISWFGDNLPREVPKIMARSYRRILSEYNSDFWGRA